MADEQDELTELREKLDRALAESERQSARAHFANNRSQLLLVVCEKALGLLKGHEHEAALQRELNEALRSESSVPPAAEDIACAKGFVP
jgi:hypothetical protein